MGSEPSRYIPDPRFTDCAAFKYAGQAFSGWGTPDLIKCTGSPGRFCPVPTGLEVFGPTTMCVEVGEGFVEVKRGQWIVVPVDGLPIVLEDALFHQLFQEL